MDQLIKRIVGGASATLSNPPHTVVLDYARVDINTNVLDCLAGIETYSFFKTFGGSAPAIRVGVGDVLEASVFEFVGWRRLQPRRSEQPGG